MVRIWKSVGGEVVHVEHLEVGAAACEIAVRQSLASGRVTGFAVGALGFSGRNQAHARAMAAVLEAAAVEMDRLIARHEGEKYSEFSELAFSNQV